MKIHESIYTKNNFQNIQSPEYELKFHNSGMLLIFENNRKQNTYFQNAIPGTK